MRNKWEDIGEVENLIESKGFNTFTVTAIVEKLLKDYAIDVNINSRNKYGKFGPRHTVALFKGGVEQKGYYTSDDLWEALVMATGEALNVLPERLKPKKIDPKLLEEDRKEVLINDRALLREYERP